MVCVHAAEGPLPTHRSIDTLARTTIFQFAKSSGREDRGCLGMRDKNQRRSRHVK